MYVPKATNFVVVMVSVVVLPSVIDGGETEAVGPVELAYRKDTSTQLIPPQEKVSFSISAMVEAFVPATPFTNVTLVGLPDTWK